MSSDAGPALDVGEVADELAIECRECEEALRSGGPTYQSVMLLDQLRIPLVGCQTHRNRFASVCGLTTTGEHELLEHPPAGGLGCPSCNLAVMHPAHPVVPVAGGAVGILGCQDHQTDVIDRYQSGLTMAEHLSASLPST